MVDCCYGQNEDNVVIFSKEVKPHISKAFDGESSTFIAFGDRGSGKTYTIQVIVVLFSMFYTFV